MHSHWHHCPETHWQWQACLSEGCCLKENEIQSCLIKKQMGVSLTEPLPWQKTFNQSFSKLQQWPVCTLTVYSFQWWPALTTDVQSTPLRYYTLERSLNTTTTTDHNHLLNYLLEIVLIEQSLQAKAILTAVKYSHVPSRANTNCLSKQLGM